MVDVLGRYKIKGAKKFALRRRSDGESLLVRWIEKDKVVIRWLGWVRVGSRTNQEPDLFFSSTWYLFSLRLKEKIKSRCLK